MRFVAHSSVWFVRRHKLTIQTGRCNTRWSKENPKPRGSNTLANDWVNSYNSHWRSHSFWRQIFLFRKLCHVALVIHFNFGHNSSRETFHLGLVGFHKIYFGFRGQCARGFRVESPVRDLAIQANPRSVVGRRASPSAWDCLCEELQFQCRNLGT